MIAAHALRRAGSAAFALAALASMTQQASATSLAVQMACATDYYAYCSKHDPEGPAVRACMRANGLKLSMRCVSALIAAGEVSMAEVTRIGGQVKATASK